MKLTIITINRNNAIGLEKTIKSVISQNSSTFEYIVVDGNSTDNSLYVINKYAQYITSWISETDTGIYNAMNKGILKANGEYLLFLNSGDLLATNQILGEALKLLDGSEIFSFALQFYTNYDIAGLIKYPPKKITSKYFYSDTLGHPSTLIKRDLFIKFGLYIESYKIASDYDFFCFLYKKRISYSSNNLVLSYFITDGISSTISETLITENQLVKKKYFPFRFYSEKTYVYLKKNIIKFEKKIRRIIKIRTRLKKIFNVTYSSKLGASYNLFDGEELLEASIKSIRSNVNYINVVYQTVSNRGNDANPELEAILKSLKIKGFIDEIIHYTPNLAKSAQYNEIEKRNIGLKAARKVGCTYFLSMDADEFYLNEEFKKSYDFIVKNNITASACSIINYFGKPEYQAIHSEDNCAVPFIYKLNSRTKLSLNGKFPCVVDPTRIVKYTKGDNFFFFTNLYMHHMKYIRNDLKIKMDNSTGLENESFVKSRNREIELALKLNDENITRYGFIKVSNHFFINIGKKS